ncbi:hypothetical protein KO566_00455 [Flavobacteriaceae bacterium XHP0103]|uniref:hypothetical protein n=1 Tax=Marixanthotalea marina TaxID=2844359 RepID=UPI002989A95E|nr:hypothetical protein [Marixanthotalea marina]MBU3820516.1 hypothetical protein [Marixanthotalea marina]
MKKKLESELVSIAHRILKLKGKEDVVKMHEEVKVLFEKLSVLKFAHENFEDDMPTIGTDSSFFDMLEDSFNNKISDSIEVEDKIYVNLDDVERDTIMEPGINTIKDMVSQMPDDTDDIDVVVDTETSPEKPNNDFDDITSGFKDMPIFEPVTKSQNGTEKKSLNDKLKTGGLAIGLNDKIAFIKHLFNGEHQDYDRVISQLNTINSYNEAINFIQNMVKPDYNNWTGKEEFEERFIGIIESKFK